MYAHRYVCICTPQIVDIQRWNGGTRYIASRALRYSTYLTTPFIHHFLLCKYSYGFNVERLKHHYYHGRLNHGLHFKLMPFSDVTFEFIS